MAILTWHAVAKVSCGRAQPAELLEARVYPVDCLDEATGPFQVWSRTCSQAEDCRATGLPCRWTGLNPNYDPFEH